MGLWTWEEVLRMYPSNCAASVSAFQFQKAPLAPLWDRMTNDGIVGEVDLGAGLESWNSYKERLSIGRSARRKRNQNQNRVIPYWFVKVVQVEGYLLKVRFLGFPSNLEDKVTEQEKWICYSQLKSLGYYVDNGGTFTMPRLSDDMVPEPKETILERLKKEMIGMRKVNPLSKGWLETQDKEIRWKKSTKVEVQNEACCTEMLPGKISKTVGRRVQVMYCGSPAFKGQGMWVHEDSDLIQLEGWAKTAGKKLNASVTAYDPAPLDPSKLADRIREGAGIKIEVDMMFELINPLKLDEISVGRVVKVLSHGYFICKIVSAVSEGDLSFVNGVNEFHFRITSEELFPLGSFAGIDEKSSPRPSDAEDVDGDQFAWASYLKVNGFKELPLPYKNNTSHVFEENMLIEAVDSHQSEFICPARIVKIVHPHAMKVHFLGWGPEFDQWKPIKSLEIFPVGWCQFRNYPLLEPLPEPEPEPERAAPIGKNTKSGDSSVPA